MSIVIYTYHDPYKLKENSELWNEITTCPYMSYVDGHYVILSVKKHCLRIFK